MVLKPDHVSVPPKDESLAGDKFEQLAAKAFVVRANGQAKNAPAAGIS